MPQVQLNTRLNIETHTKLKDYAKASGKSLASIIEEALNKYLEEDTPMKLTEWQEKMHEEVEGTVHISKIMDVPHHQDTVRYQVYNEEGTFDKLFDITFNEEDEITNID